MKIVLCTALALTAFATNSILNKLALQGHTIDAASFTVIRLISGMGALLIFSKITQKGKRPIMSQKYGSWSAAIALFIYALCFSYAYLFLDTGVGALILFGTVQITMILKGLLTGRKLYISEWIGVFTAFVGFVYLILPNLSTPSLLGFILMTIAGVSWATYTLLGRGSTAPLLDTAQNFLRTLPFTIILMLAALYHASLSMEGVLLAIASGALASGAGYTVWYSALRGLSTTRAAVVQLLVPILAAIGGVIFSHEVISQRLIISSLKVLGGIMVVFLTKHKSQKTP